MTWPTHALAGISSLWLLSAVPADILGYDLGTLSACAVFGALLPDMDASESKIKHLRLAGTNIKPFFLPSQIVYSTNQHRGLLHSLAGWLMIALIALPVTAWLGWAPWLAFLLGYGSHLVIDSATKSGIMWLYPRRTRYYLLPKNWRITTGSQAEEACFAVAAVATLSLLLHSLK